MYRIDDHKIAILYESINENSMILSDSAYILFYSYEKWYYKKILKIKLSINFNL